MLRRFLLAAWQRINLTVILLLPFSLLFCALASLRRYAYQHGWWRVFKSDVPVIVVGNISLGGTGKTPLVIYLAQELTRQGYRVGIVSRGYGASHPDLRQGKVVALLPSMLTRIDDSELIGYGDEPLMIARETQCPVVLARQRVQAVAYANTHYHCDIIISDDGMQHYAMQRMIEICVVDAQKQFGNGLCLPAGPLRERPARLNQVDFVIYQQLSLQNRYALEMVLQIDKIIALDESVQYTTDTFVEKLGGKSIHALAGIGNPQRFFIHLRELGLQLIPHEFADHYPYQLQDLQFGDDLPVLMTAKDAVKCRAFARANWYYAQTRLVVNQDLTRMVLKKCQLSGEQYA